MPDERHPSAAERTVSDLITMLRRGLDRSHTRATEIRAKAEQEFTYALYALLDRWAEERAVYRHCPRCRQMLSFRGFAVHHQRDVPPELGGGARCRAWEGP